MPALLRFTGALASDPRIERWLSAQPAALQALARTWFVPMRSSGPDVRELMHDGCATVCIEDAPFAYVGVFRAHVNVGFFHGSTLDDPHRLMLGGGRSMRHVKLAPGVAIDDDALRSLIAAAYGDIVARLRDDAQDDILGRQTSRR
jgi:hypothetical protein